MIRILGVDPGSRLTGYGCIDHSGREIRHVTHGTLHLTDSAGTGQDLLQDRLLGIYQGLSRVIREVRPQVMVVERVFFAKNALSALKLGQARGAVILTGMIHALKIAEYSPTEVKQAVVGHGRADKNQVAQMVQMILGRQVFDTLDASDALALAICHSHFGNPKFSTLHLPAIPRKKRKLSLAESVGVRMSGKTQK